LGRKKVHETHLVLLVEGSVCNRKRGLKLNRGGFAKRKEK